MREWIYKLAWLIIQTLLFNMQNKLSVLQYLGSEMQAENHP